MTTVIEFFAVASRPAFTEFSGGPDARSRVAGVVAIGSAIAVQSPIRVVADAEDWVDDANAVVAWARTFTLACPSHGRDQFLLSRGV
jgi:hypothetical protein